MAATRDKGGLDQILQAIVDRLIGQINGLTKATCYHCLDPDALPMSNPGGHIFVVAPTSGTFDEGMYAGGGLETLMASGGIVVKIHAPLNVDEPQREAALLTNLSLGVMGLASKTIKALANPEWSPQFDEHVLTRDPLIPSGYAITRSDKRVGAIELTFKCNFDWDADPAAGG